MKDNPIDLGEFGKDLILAGIILMLIGWLGHYLC